MPRSALAAVTALVLLTGTSSGELVDRVSATAQQYYAKMGSIAPVAGGDTTYDYYQRLTDDEKLLRDATVPRGYDAAQWARVTRTMARLDMSLAEQLLSKSYVAMASIRGLGETLVRSSADGTLQPVAVYVPPSYSPDRPAPLVVFLHGHPQSETSLLAPQYVADLAKRTGSIVVAPWAHGYYDYRGSAREVYDALHAAEKAFAVDPRKRYLVGYSMGGFSVFEVAPLHANDWAAVMSIAGSLLGEDAARFIVDMRKTPLYVLTGSADESIPTQYPTATAVYLRSKGLDVSFYAEPGGIHRLATLLPIFTRAWDDMHAGIVRALPPNLAAGALPSVIPINGLRP